MQPRTPVASDGPEIADRKPGRVTAVGFIARDAGGERDQRELVVEPGYGETRVVFDGSRGTSGLSSRVGSRNLPIVAFLGAFLDAGLRIESFDELDTRGRPWVAEAHDRTLVPWNIVLVAAKP